MQDTYLAVENPEQDTCARWRTVRAHSAAGCSLHRACHIVDGEGGRDGEGSAVLHCSFFLSRPLPLLSAAVAAASSASLPSLSLRAGAAELGCTCTNALPAQTQHGLSASMNASFGTPSGAVSATVLELLSAESLSRHCSLGYAFPVFFSFRFVFFPDTTVVIIRQ